MIFNSLITFHQIIIKSLNLNIFSKKSINLVKNRIWWNDRTSSLIHVSFQGGSSVAQTVVPQSLQSLRSTIEEWNSRCHNSQQAKIAGIAIGEEILREGAAKKVDLAQINCALTAVSPP